MPKRTPSEKNTLRWQLLRNSKWIAVIIYIVAIYPAALAYRDNSPLFWLWAAIVLGCGVWFVHVIIKDK
jgi:hypothetical protein